MPPIPPDYEKLTDEEKAAFESFQAYENIIKADLTDERSSDEVSEVSLVRITTKFKEKNYPYSKTKKIVQNGVVVPHNIKISIFRRVMIKIYGLIDFLTSPIIG